MRLARAALLMLAATVAFAAEDGLSARLEFARKAAQANASTRDGRAWQRSNSAAFGPALSPLVAKCISASNSGPRPFFVAYLRLSKAGRVLEVVPDGNGPFAECMSKGLTSVGLPAAPRDDYWIRLQLGKR